MGILLRHMLSIEMSGQNQTSMKHKRSKIGFGLFHVSISAGVGVGSPFIYHPNSEQPLEEIIRTKNTGNKIIFISVVY